MWRFFSTEMHGQAATFRSTCGFVPKAPGALALTRSELQTDWKTKKVPMKNKVKNTKIKTKQVNNHKPCTTVRRRTWKSKVFPHKSRAFIMRAEVLGSKQFPLCRSSHCPLNHICRDYGKPQQELAKLQITAECYLTSRAVPISFHWSSPHSAAV